MRTPVGAVLPRHRPNDAERIEEAGPMPVLLLAPMRCPTALAGRLGGRARPRDDCSVAPAPPAPRRIGSNRCHRRCPQRGWQMTTDAGPRRTPGRGLSLDPLSILVGFASP